MKLLQLTSLKEALEKISQITIKCETEIVEIDDSLNRTLASDIVANEDVPNFDRSTVDGYAVISKDLFGASFSIPTYQNIISSIKMGEQTTSLINNGEVCYIPTGGMLPKNSDAVVMVEYTENISLDEVAIMQSVAPYENVMRKGFDISAGEIILKSGKKILPQDIGILAALGIKKVKVRKKLKAAIISTGDELIDIDETIEIGKVRDINGYFLKALLKDLGVFTNEYKVICDDYKILKSNINKLVKENDLLIISGGSSVGNKDYTEKIIGEIEGVKKIINGLAVKPGKPTIVSKTDDCVIFGLPGHPGSAFVVFNVIVKPLIKMLTDNEGDFPYSVEAVLTENIHSKEGKTTFQMVTLKCVDNSYYVTPMYNKSGAISLFSKANGYLIIEEGIEGLVQGDVVKVYKF